MAKAKYKRILLKLSGEAMAAEGGVGIDPKRAELIAHEIKNAHGLKVEMAVVIGGGNIFRGLHAAAAGMERVTADNMGMLATVINALALQDALESMGVVTRVQTAIDMHALAEPYIRRRAIRHLEKGRVVIFAGGTGNPFFTTDTAAALRAAEIGADVIMKATKVDGVYTADPLLEPAAEKYDEVSYIECLQKGLKVMDSTALSLCMDNDVPIIVFNLFVPGNVSRVVKGEVVGTMVRGEGVG